MGLELTTKRSSDGFTLIELVIVLMVISISLVYVMPKIESGTGMSLDKSVRNLRSAIIYVRNEAIFRKKKLRIKYNFDENTYSIKEIARKRFEYSQEDYEENELATMKLEDGISFLDIKTAYGGKVSYGNTYTHFFSNGMVEKTVIYLKDENEKIRTLDVSVLSGEVDTYNEYYEESDWR
ncbi:Tfp pilus assembly protein FimT/FimU [Thermodesulfobacteriota bacterium]